MAVEQIFHMEQEIDFVFVVVFWRDGGGKISVTLGWILLRFIPTGYF